MANNGRGLGKLDENLSKVSTRNVKKLLSTVFAMKSCNGDERNQLVSLGRRLVEISFGAWKEMTVYHAKGAYNKCVYCDMETLSHVRPLHEDDCMYRLVISEQKESAIETWV